jgi:hypothetical protein
MYIMNISSINLVSNPSLSVNLTNSKTIQGNIALDISNTVFTNGSNAYTAYDTVGNGSWKIYSTINTSIAAVTGASAASEWTQGNLLNAEIPSITDYLWYFPISSTTVSGTNLKDSTNTLNATLSSSSMFVSDVPSPSPGNHYMSFTSSSSHFVTLPIFTPSSNGLSFSLWFAANSSGEESRILEFGNGPNTQNITLCLISNNLYSSILRAPDDRTLQTNSLGISINNNIWRHLVWTITPTGGSSATWRFYLNGSLVNTFTGMYYPTQTTYVTNYLGRSNWSGIPYFNGSIDDLRIYNRVLTVQEVGYIYNLPTVYYGFESVDLSSNNTNFANNATHVPLYDGTLVGATIAVNAGSRVPGKGYLSLVKTSNQYARFCPVNISTYGFTVAFWLISNASSAGAARIIDLRNPELSLTVNTDLVRLFVTSGPNTVFSSPNINNNVWNHIALSVQYAGSSSVYSYYYNGAFVSSVTGTYPATGMRATYNIGNYGDNPDVTGERLNGGVDDFYFFNRSLGATEIANIYAGATGFPNGKMNQYGAAFSLKPGLPIDTSETAYTLKSTEIALKPGTSNNIYAVWTAPSLSNIYVDVSFANYNAQSTSGVGFQMFKINNDDSFGSVVYSRTVTTNALTNVAPTNYLSVPAAKLSVAPGDKLYFRADNNGNTTSSSCLLAVNLTSYTGLY